MHPIERLRWIARARDEDPTTLAVEAALTISELAAEDPAAVVTACRRLIESHLTAGPLWWVAASLLSAPDAHDLGGRLADELLEDTTADLLANLLELRVAAAPMTLAWPATISLEALSRLGSPVVRVVGASPSRRSEARRLGATVAHATHWAFTEADDAVAGAGVVLVDALAAGEQGVLAADGVEELAQAAKRVSVPVWAVVGAGRLLQSQILDEMLRRADGSAALVPPGLLAAVAGPSGLQVPAEALGAGDCPPAPELLVRAR